MGIDNNIPAGADIPSAPFNADLETETPPHWEDVFNALDDPYNTLWEAVGPDGCDRKTQEESLFAAILNDDWMEVGRQLRFAKDYIMEVYEK